MVFSPAALPSTARTAFENRLNPWEVAAVAAFDAGMTDLDTIADIAFYHAHRDLLGRALGRDLPNYSELSREWTGWRDIVASMFGPGYGTGGSSAPTPRPDRNEERLKANLGFAQTAVRYTRSVLPHGAGNKWDDVVNSKGLSLLGSFAAKLGGAFIDVGASWDICELRTLALYARAGGAGHCGEQSAVAFLFLYDMGLGPLDIMSRVYEDHQFVVIGRTGNPDKPLEYGDSAVICDPWANESYPARDVADRMGSSVRTISTIHTGEQFCKAN